MTKIAVIDYGMGNLFSLGKALEYVGATFQCLTGAEQLQDYDKAIIHGVGAFFDGAANLNKKSWMPEIVEFSKTKPLLGICLGMQLLADCGWEPAHALGLGIVSRSEERRVGKECRSR